MEATALASTIHDSFALTATLSALHALGFTLLMSGSLLANLRFAGLMFAGRSVREVARPGMNAMVVGLAVSIPTGVLSFLPRAVAASANPTFQLKMVLLVVAIGLQLVTATVTQRATENARAGRVLGSLGLLAWIGLGLTACAFILLE